ncbi:tetratricopeptide repeat protein [Paenibacillus sp. 481]|uniref:tetratricopeptide repeat protein n=1 Tax=Paenibacillus sp. 481 TaxID=2835869 RepID=UPI001E471B2D|nr:tetratricopeptide repeat protein [Paenibacillus sp. 481]UHA72996.1 hypothetical protein KIK04_20690 [Paenibacillus sp. 481]
MLQQVFETMNLLLDEISEQYSSAQGEQKQELERQLSLLSSMSDHIVDEWLRFEEKLAEVRPRAKDAGAAASAVTAYAVGSPAGSTKQAAPQMLDYGDPLQRGQGYFALNMFKHAVRYFELAVEHQPDSLTARGWLAMSHLHLGSSQEACRHFNFIIPLTEDNKLKALSYNALGCIYAKDLQFDKAQQFFEKAYQTDPTLQEALQNLKACSGKKGTLHYGSERMAQMA